MIDGIFLTGTDTGVGKTLVAGLLARYLKRRDVSVVTQKWVQTGCVGVSEDIETHLKIMGVNGADVAEHIAMISPYILTYPASPHLAAERDKKTIEPSKIIKAYKALSAKFEHVVVEGAGGWLVPISRKATCADVVKEMLLPVLIVAENRLGAINHTLLTIESVRSKGLNVLGVVFNRISGDGDEHLLEDNKRIVSEITGVNVLGELAFSADMDELVNSFSGIGDKYIDLVSKK
ncbi:MAG: dethiobiotin synthase [Candidatus Omnitrophica bacterium]|nr:dethiobiotin synthase [Candidatus Omnitrophota bacterium]